MHPLAKPFVTTVYGGLLLCADEKVLAMRSTGTTGGYGYNRLPVTLALAMNLILYFRGGVSDIY